MTTRFFPHWERLDKVAETTGVDVRTLMWENPFLPPATLPYLPPDGFRVHYPAGSLNPDFTLQVPEDMRALRDRLTAG